MEQRVAKLEADVGEIKVTLGALAPRIHEMHAFMQAKLPDIATKADVAILRGDVLEKIAEKPGKGYLWTVLAVLVGAILAATAAGVSIATSRMKPADPPAAQAQPINPPRP